MDDRVNVSVPTIKILQAAQATKVMGMPGAIESQEADSADAITEWLQRLQLQLGGAFTWATEETEDGFTINGERYQIEGLLGEGSFGSVYRCLLDGQGVAVKVLSTERIAVMTNCPQHVVLRRMLQEAEILGCLGGHPNIVQLRVAAVSQQTLRIYLVMQLLECGDLFSEMLRRRRQPFSERDAREALTQVTMAVVHCHRRGVAHRDIKLENLMVAGRRPLMVKLIDFGQAVMHHDQSQQRMQSVAKTLTTTSAYTPPEVQKATEEHESYDPFKLDSFAVGVVMYALLLNALPKTSRGFDYEKHPKFPLLSVNAQDLIKQLMEPDPQRRISVADALQHPWLLSRGDTNTSRTSSRTHTPLVMESEMQVLLAAQELNKALQRERGSSCWLLSGSEEAENVCRWFCKSTDECYIKLQEGVACTQLDEQRQEIDRRISQMSDMTQRLRLECRNLRFVPKMNREDNFDVVFGGYCTLNEDIISLIGLLLTALKGPDTQVMMIELKLRMLLHVAEQLGRERGFISFQIGRPDALQSVRAQLRFAKIQGVRQYLVGSSAPQMQPEVVSCSEGLLPSLRLADEPILTTEELQSLEAAENSVMQGHNNTSEWFAFLTGMIDKVHQHVGLVIGAFIQEISSKTPVMEMDAITSAASMSEMSATSTPTVPPSSGVRGLSKDTSAFGGSRERSNTLGDIAKRQLTPNTRHDFQKVLPLSSPLFMQGSPPELGSVSSGHSLPLESRQRTPQHLPGSTLLPQFTPSAAPIAPFDGVSEYGYLAQVQAAAAAQDTARRIQDNFNAELLEQLARVGPMNPDQHLAAPRVPLYLSTPERTPLHPGLSVSGADPGLLAAQLAQTSVAQQQVLQTVCPPVPVRDAPQLPESRNVVISKGTIGHPHSCRGLGCKFASKERGCREGADCLRCHLCIWSRASEKAATDQEKAAQLA